MSDHAGGAANPASTNTSATGGYILDRPPGPPTAHELEHVVQHMVATLANLPGTLTRPRWQPTPPTQPPPEVTWCSVGITRIEADEFPELIHHGEMQLPGARGKGASIQRRHGTVTVLATFYGPHCEDAAAQLRDGLYVPQQIEGMHPFKLFSVRDLSRAPELVNQQWINRVDLEIQLRLQSERVFPIFNIEAADVVVRTEEGIRNVVIVREDQPP